MSMITLMSFGDHLITTVIYSYFYTSANVHLKNLCFVELYSRWLIKLLLSCYKSCLVQQLLAKLGNFRPLHACGAHAWVLNKLMSKNNSKPVL